MNESEKEIRLKLKADFLHYAAACLNIRTKQGAIRKLELNAAQKFVHDRLEEQLKTTGRVRALIVKGRQQGVSTYVEARFYWKVTHNSGARAFILAHLEDATRNLFSIMKRFHDNCPYPVKAHEGRANAREMLFDRLDSGYHVGTAKSRGVGRSDTLQYFHGSEVAYWANAKEHMSGVLQAVADLGGTEIILESTSAGAQGLFYKLCDDARAGRSDYQLVFVPWFMQGEYRREPPQGFALTAEEEDYKRAHRLDDAQMCWRRAKIYETGNIWTFRREYPATVDEAFHADRADALWTRETLQINRVDADDAPQMRRIVVAIDPATTAKNGSDETGIIVAGLGVDGHGYVLEDASGKYTPAEWASKALNAFKKHKADRIVAEVNQGGDMVEHTLRTYEPNVPYKAVHASRGKITRAEPIAALDEQSRIHHVGVFGALEDQMCRFVADGKQSPDRVDARVWALTELMLNRAPQGPVIWR